jgi:putative membrane protein
MERESPERPGRAADRDEPRVREHLANERTLLSWVRLGLSCAGLGFVVARFGLFLREAAGEAAAGHPGRFTTWAGVALILAGPLLVVIAATRYFRIENEIDAGIYTRRYGAIWALLTASILLGLVLAGYLLLAGW